MRVVAEVPHPHVKITIFAWNGKYLLKLERGPFEQTYKVSEMDIYNEAEVKDLLDEEFINNALKRFSEMNQDLQETLERHT
ncbi:hypothetical protein [Adhaeribacter aquaticus]|uniref:hypothetical protein n=1 Tax=Adhaeribacter aquaticus TaxID=299567 RepID=UPI000415D648|nr:hypothetical protein [Adhaeribacter aquaticus]